MSDTNQVLTKLLKSLEDIQAIDVKVIDVRQQTSVTDYMIVATARATRHVKAIANKVMEDMKHANVPAVSSTGLENADWVLIDFGDYIVHIMTAESRQFYNLEGLWEERS